MAYSSTCVPWWIPFRATWYLWLIAQGLTSITESKDASCRHPFLMLHYWKKVFHSRSDILDVNVLSSGGVMTLVPTLDCDSPWWLLGLLESLWSYVWVVPDWIELHGIGSSCELSRFVFGFKAVYPAWFMLHYLPCLISLPLVVLQLDSQLSDLFLFLLHLVSHPEDFRLCFRYAN